MWPPNQCDFVCSGEGYHRRPTRCCKHSAPLRDRATKGYVETALPIPGRRSSWSVTANSRLWSTQDRNTRQRRHLILWSCVHCRVRRQLLVPSDQQTRVSSPVRSPELICDWVAIEDAANAASLTTRHSAFRATYAIKAIMTHSTCLTSWLVDPLRKRNLWYWLSTQRRWCLHR